MLTSIEHITRRKISGNWSEPIGLAAWVIALEGAGQIVTIVPMMSGWGLAVLEHVMIESLRFKAMDGDEFRKLRRLSESFSINFEKVLYDNLKSILVDGEDIHIAPELACTDTWKQYITKRPYATLDEVLEKHKSHCSQEESLRILMIGRMFGYESVHIPVCNDLTAD